MNCKQIVADFTVLGTGDLTLRAGTGIELRNGTAVEPGGTATFVIDPQLQMPRLVFVTSMSYDGDLGGLSGADGECQALAGAASLPGVFKAWLGDNFSGPADRFTQAAVPYQRVDGVRVADDWADLTDDSLQAPINITETGGVFGGCCAWTNVLSNGQEEGVPDRSCTSVWTSNSPGDEGAVGEIQRTIFTWTFSNSRVPCNQQHRLYCFQQ